MNQELRELGKAVEKALDAAYAGPGGRAGIVAAQITALLFTPTFVACEGCGTTAAMGPSALPRALTEGVCPGCGRLIVAIQTAEAD